MHKNPVGSLIARLQAGLLRTPRASNTEETQPGGAARDTNRATQETSRYAGDQLARAISDIASHFGNPAAPATLTAGLPLVNGRLPFEHVDLAAARANLACEPVMRDPLALADHELPVIVVRPDDTIALLWAVDRNEKGQPVRAQISSPGNLQQRSHVPLGMPNTPFHVAALSLRPADGLDSRADEALDRGTQNWFLPAFRDSRKIYSEAIAATIAINVLGLAVPLFSMNVYDRVLPNAAEATLWALAIGVMIAIVFEFSLRTLRAYYVDAASRRADVRLSNLIYGRLMGAKLAGRSSSIGVRANTMREFETLREFINSATLTAFGDLPFLVLFISVMWIVAGPVAFVVIAAIPIILGVGWMTQRTLQKLITQAFREAAQKNAVVVESLTGMESIKAAGAESWAANKWERSVAEHIRLGLGIRHVTNLGQHTIHAVQTFVQVAVVVFGFYLVAQGHMTMGALIAATILSGRALQPLAQAANLLARLNQARIAYQTLGEIVNAQQERNDKASYLSKTTCDGNVTFENVTFAYAPDAQPALAEFSLTAKPGEHLAIIGGIGSGKTTALKLLQGFYAPTLGRVLIDGISVSQIEPALLRTHVGLLLQDAELFHGTIRENITIADPASPDDAVIQAAHTSGALDWIATLPQGFDTPLAERGGGLSGGQRQTLALARTLLRKPKILALDEPTSDMDGRTEQRVITRLKRWAENRTLIIVTHRPAALELVDRMIVVEAGKKIEDGPKSAVLTALKARAAPASGNQKVAKTKTRTIVKTVTPAQKTTKKKTTPAQQRGGRKGAVE